MSKIELRNINKKFGNVTAIHSIDLKIEDGSFIVFVGPSGCGKSTLLRMIAGLETISSGELVINDEVVNQVHPKERGIAMVFQSYALYPHMTVYKNMAFGLKLSKMSKQTIDSKVLEVAEILQLTPLLSRLPKELSGGQRQRVAIGRAIVRDPKVFLFDEPLSNLDASLRVQMRIEIAKLHEDLKTTMIYVTHDQVEAMTLADKIVVLSEGKLEQYGSPLEIYHYPQNKFVANFIGSPSMNFIEAKITKAGSNKTSVKTKSDFNINLDIDSSKSKVGDVVTVGIRPEDIYSVSLSKSKATLSNCMSGKIFVIEQLGETHYYYIKLGITNELMIVKQDGPALFTVGQTISFKVDSLKSHLFHKNGLAFKKTKKIKNIKI